MFENQVIDVDELKARIRNVVDSVLPDMLVNSRKVEVASGETTGEWREAC